MKPLFAMPARAPSGRGFTLVEVLVAMVIIGGVVMAFIMSFGGIAKGVLMSKSQMLASNLAQEKMQILKQMNYYRLLVTSAPVYLTQFDPPIPYDGGYFPPERILEGGLEFTRVAYVQVAQEVNGVVQTLPPTTPDTGMRQITVTVAWQTANGWRRTQLRSVTSNPAMSVANAIIRGQVRNAATFAPIAGAVITVAENIGWRDETDTAGSYDMNVMPGSYVLMASARGYFPKSAWLSVGTALVTQDFDLVAQASGTVFGTAWINDHPVIASVVASSVNALTAVDQEYVELFNPTTYTWLMRDPFSNTDLITLKYYPLDAAPFNVKLQYLSTSIPPKAGYLIANTAQVTVCGVTRFADAVYDPTTPEYPNVIKCREDNPQHEAAGALSILRLSDNAELDLVGWSGSKNGVPRPSPRHEDTPITQNIGFQRNQQYVRKTWNDSVTPGLGRCYDSGNNSWDFILAQPLVHVPGNSGLMATVIAGVPARGAMVTATDGLSSGVSVTLQGTPPLPVFALTSVATGTWVVIVSSNANMLEISSVTVAASVSTGVPNGVTQPPAPWGGIASAILSVGEESGYISGRVINAYTGVISPPVYVAASYQQVQHNALGNYFLKLPPGTYAVTANPGNINPMYVSMLTEGVVVQQGQVTSGVDFILSQGGAVRGFITRDGINPLMGVVVVAEDTSLLVRGDGISGGDGRYEIANLSTGSYVIRPVLGSGEKSSPVQLPVTVTGGMTVFAGTFTITGAFGRIAGSVVAGSEPVRTGVTLIATTVTVATPPILNAATLTGPVYYIGSSGEDGTYGIDVRAAAAGAYRVYAYYTVLQGTVPVTSVRSTSGLTVLPGQTLSGVNFTW
jgi:prepilin-type N-terminal cleavage/methylation domain-containing protein